MDKIKLITDSTCDLPETLLKEYTIDVIPLYVNFEETSYFDGIDLTPEKMYKIVEETGVFPKTAAASPGAFLETFERYIKDGYKIIYIGIGSKFSGTFLSAKTAKDMIETEDIYLIDSQNLSSGSGLLLLKAASFIKKGDNAETVVEKVTALVPKVRSQFVIDTFDYLHKGGRINGLQNLMGTMLRLKPIIKVVNGEMQVGKKARINTKNGAKILVQEVLDLNERLDPEFLMITHSFADETYEYIYEALKGKVKVKNIYESHAGCVISSHCGKGTIGILYILR
jgi:DegV family protein with EDD domain